MSEPVPPLRPDFTITHKVVDSGGCAMLIGTVLVLVVMVVFGAIGYDRWRS